MPYRPLAASGTLLGRVGRRSLLTGASLLAIVSTAGLPASPAQAGNILVGNRLAAPSTNAAAAAIASAQQAAAMTQQSMNSLTRATQAIQAMQQAQSAARNLALSGANNLGLDPNHPGQQLPNVPNGLAAGGLVPDSGLAGNGVANQVTSWVNANAPTQSTGNGQTTVTVQQTGQKAILNWSSFNIGKNTELHLNQSVGTAADGSNNWVALNWVNDPTGVPSQILGSIKAEGSVYLISHNGIIFGGSAQVNVNSLIASSLNLFSNTFGDPNTPGTSVYRFLNGGIGDLNKSNVGTDSILLTTDAPGAGDITIAPGASIDVGAQGLALIAAPNVTNGGAVNASSGQVALIAGIGVSYAYGISANANDSSNPQDTSGNSTTDLRFANYGKLVDSGGNDITPVGTLVNNGLILSLRGNITLLGGVVQQHGVAAATTSVQQPGSIVIESLYEVGVNSGSQNPADETHANFYTGAITFGPQSVTTILPDSNGVTLPSDLTSLAPWQQPPSAGAGLTPLFPTQGFGIVGIVGQAIDFQDGTLVYAPGQGIGATVVVLKDPRPSVPAVAGSGRILLETGAVLDASGIPDTVLPVSANLLTVKLAGNELADDPLQQNGFLYGATVTVDMGDEGVNSETGESWVGTPLANLASYANLVQNTIGQLLVNGGTVNLSANEVDTAPGSVINLMGGYVHYTGGMIQTTLLLGADGHIYDIGSASPDIPYVGLAGQFTVDHSRWGVSETYTSPLISGGYDEPDYVQGGNAGSLAVAMDANTGVAGGQAVAGSGATVLDATLLAGVVSGTRQVASDTPPTGGSFKLSSVLPIEISDPALASADALTALSLPSGFGMASPLLAAPGSAYAEANVVDSTILDGAGLANIALGAGGLSPGGASYQPIVEDAGATLSVQPRGSISLLGDTATINGTLTARGGVINITTTPNIETNGPASDLLVGSNAVLDVSGFFVNDLLLPAGQVSPALPINAGSISLIAESGTNVDIVTSQPPASGFVDTSGNITLASGSVLDLEGGGHMLRNGKLQAGSNGAPAGSGGSLTLQASNAGLAAVMNGTAPDVNQGRLIIQDGVTIDALGMSGGGTLTITQNALQVGGDPAALPAGTYYFDPAYWGDRGFASFNLNSLTQAAIPDGAVIHLTHRNLLPDFAAMAQAPTGADPAAYAAAGYLSGMLLSPTNLNIAAGLEENVTGGSLVHTGDDTVTLGAGAQILADPGAAISLSSYVGTIIQGTIRAPGGTISLAMSASTGSVSPVAPLYLGPSSVLDVSGTTVIDPLAALVFTRNGYVQPLTGKMLAGGTINLSDDLSPLLIAPGAVLNVSGASGAFDVAQLAPGGALDRNQLVLTREAQWSDAGQINIKAANGLLIEGTLIGKGGAPQAAGGTLAITGDSRGSGFTTDLILVEDTTQALTDAGATFNFTTYIPSIQPESAASIQVDPKVPAGILLVGADRLSGSGFDNLVLSGTIGYTGQVTLTLKKSVIFNAGLILAGNQGNYIWTTGPVLPGGANRTTKGPNGLPASLTVNAPYIALTGTSVNSGGFPPLTQPVVADASLTLNASQIDVSAFLSVGNIGQVTMNSIGDIRLLPSRIVPEATTQLAGYLTSGGNIALNAADIYPATDTAFVLQSTATNGTIAIGYPTDGGPSAATPLSADGAIVLSAANIVQDGELTAPFGQIFLGSAAGASAIPNLLGVSALNSPFGNAIATQSVTLGSGSITSVSADGATIPFGATVDQTTWIYNPELNNLTWSNAEVYSSSAVGFIPNQNVAYADPLTGAPQGAVSVTGASIAYQSGATVDVSGGGDLQAQEWIPGTGGSRDVLSQYNTSYQNSTAGTQVPLFPDARQIYAILPGYASVVAPYDATLSQAGLGVGQAVYLAGGNGLPAGVYTLLPAKYATLPGAYRVVVNSGVTNPLVTATQTLADGTMVMAGYMTDAITGAHPSVTQQFEVQSGATWERYSQYAFTSANIFFPQYAVLNDLAMPYVPNDAGRLVLQATNGLTLNGSFVGNAGEGGFGGQVDVSAQFIEITGANETPDAGYLAIDAQSLDDLGADSLLIGGTRQMTSEGTVITPTANGVIIANDAADPLTGPEILLVAAPQLQTSTIKLDNENDVATIKTPVAGTGQVVIRSGSVIEVQGSGHVGGQTLILGKPQDTLPVLPTSETASDVGNTRAIIQNYYSTLDAGLGTLVELSSGSPDKVELPSAAQISPGTIAVQDDLGTTTVPFTIVLPSLLGGASATGVVIQSGAQLAGGNVLTLATTGDTTVQSGALLSASNISATNSSITFVGSGPAPASGMVIDAGMLAQLEQASSVMLESYNAIAFQGDVDIQMADAAGTLTLGGGLSSDGGKVTISAPTLVLDNETGAQQSASGGTGSLTINAGELVFGNGAKSLAGFGSLSLTASEGVVGQGTGSTDFGALDVTLATPVVIADTSSSQTLTIIGALSVTPTSGTAMTADALGGAITLRGSSVTVAVPVEAVAGNIDLVATGGDVTLTGTGSLIAHGLAKQFGDTTEYASGGMITLTAKQGSIDLQSGSIVDFAGAQGGGNGGSLAIDASGSTPVSFGGTLLGATAAGYAGSLFDMTSGGTVALDDLAQILTNAGVAGEVSIESAQGDLALSTTLAATHVGLTADGGSVTVTGSITADGDAVASGEIDLYGTAGVDVEGTLTATGSPNSPKPGGIINIGTSGTGSTTSLNATYGYENVDPTGSGTITIGSNAVIDASGGTVTLRAPILDALNTQGINVNVAVAPSAQIEAGSVFLDAYAVWSTADQSTNPNQHFDGYVDPAGWYNASGTLVAGSFQDVNGNTVASWSGAALSGCSGACNTLSYYLTNDYFTPTTYYAAHAVFYGGYNPNSEAFNPASPDAGSLPDFVQHPMLQLGNAFSGVANLTARPEIDLVNPNGSVDNGNIGVLTNWNLGAGVMNADGSLTLAYRYQGAVAPVVALRAAGNLDINASISDGFFTSASVPILGMSSLAQYTAASNGYTTDTGNYSLNLSGGHVTFPYEPLFQGNTSASIYSFNAAAKTVTLTGATTMSSLEPNDTYYNELQAPQSGGSIAYYDIYTKYTSLYNSWENQIVRPVERATYNYTSSIKYNYYLLDPSLAQAPATAAPLLSGFKSYSDYATAYSNWINGLSTGSSGTIAYTPPTPPPSTDLSLTDWSAYYITAYSKYQYLGNQTTILSPTVLSKNYVVVYEQAPAPMPAGLFQPYVAPSYGDSSANLPSNMTRADTPMPLSFASLVTGQSSSYQLVAGAAAASANPLAVDGNGTDNVLIDDHTAWLQLNDTNAEMVVPTTVRTGTGSIDIAAAGNFDLVDTTAPGVVYTAGAPLQPPTGNTSIALGDGAWNNGTGKAIGTGISTILTPDVNPANAGNITINTGGDIIGVENVSDTLARGSGGGGNPAPASGLTSNQGSFVGQFWMSWLLTDPDDPNVPWYVNFGSFDQGIMSVGGDVTIKAGGDIRDLAVSTPTTSWLDSAKTQHITGGGNLSVIAGGSIYSGDFYVGQGAGSIRAGGAIAPDFTFVTNKASQNAGLAYPVQTLLAVQYSTIAVEARQSADIGGVFDPTYLANFTQKSGNTPIGSVNAANGTPITFIPYVTSMSPDSGTSIQSTSGDVTFNSLLVQTALFNLGKATDASADGFDSAGVSSLLLPASLNLVALDGGIDIQHGGGLYPSKTGTLSIVADQSIDLAVPLLLAAGPDIRTSEYPVVGFAGNVSGATLGKLDYQVGTGTLPTGANPTLIDLSQLTPVQYRDPSLVQADATASVVVYSLDGSLVDGAAGLNGSTQGQISLIPNAPAQIYAAEDILDLPFFGENFDAADITSLIAGRDIRYNILGNVVPAAIEIAGPGMLDVEVGRDLSFQSQRLILNSQTGIRTIGNAIDPSAAPYGPWTASTAPDAATLNLMQFGNPNLPPGGAAVNILFGVAPGTEYADFAARYVDPAQGVSVIADEPALLADLVKRYLKARGTPMTDLTADQAWSIFNTMPAAWQHLVDQQIFLDVLNETGLDYNNSASSRFHQYAQGYEAINTLFPAALGYTENALSGGSNGANQLVSTGTFDMRNSTVQTQQGGDISILGPGGRILVGSSVAAPAVDPASEGILTLESGSIATFTDTDVLVAQSRVMTEQGGNILMWSSNGNLDAGKGAKTSVSAPPPLYACDIDWICTADIKGAVSGAGIATLQSLPGVPVGDANLIAPRGTVDAGAAGIRASGNLNVAALQVLNAFNIQVQGTVTGIPTAPTPNLGALTTASNAAGQAAAAANEAASRTRSQPVPQDLPSIITVEVIGYGGGDGTPSPQDGGRNKPIKRSSNDSPDGRAIQSSQATGYDTRSAVQILGSGVLGNAENQYLTQEEQRRLNAP